MKKTNVQRKSDHGMKIGDRKEFKTLQDIQDFCDKFTYFEGEFQFVTDKPLTMEKVQ